MDGTVFRGRQLAIALTCLSCSLLLIVSQRTLGCPFCLSPPQTLAEQISGADVVLIAELVRFRVLNQGTKPESTLRIREYLAGKELVSGRREMAAGQTLVINAEAAGQPGDLFLMFGYFPEGLVETSPPALAFSSVASAASATSNSSSPVVIRASAQSEAVNRIEKTSLVIPEFISWVETIAISNSAVYYLKNIPGKEIDQQRRLTWFMDFLEHEDPMIAIDAWAEFGCSSYEDVVGVRHLMPRNKLRAWIEDPLMSPERLGLYGMMLGLCGEDSDSQFLKDHMYDREPQGLRLRFGSEGLMAGYLLLTKEPGLRDLEKTLILPPDVPDTAAHAFVQALQFLWSYERDIIPEDRLRESMRLLLKNAAMREIAVTNLSRWEDWTTLSALTVMFDKECGDDVSVQRAIVQFAQACEKAEMSNEPLSEHTSAAAQFLRRVQESRPQLLASPLQDFTAPQ